jgi:hypothetical protein
MYVLPYLYLSAVLISTPLIKYTDTKHCYRSWIPYVIQFCKLHTVVAAVAIVILLQLIFVVHYNCIMFSRQNRTTRSMHNIYDANMGFIQSGNYSLNNLSPLLQKT